MVGWLDVSRAGTFSKLEIAGVLRQFNAPTIDGTIFLSQPFPLALSRARSRASLYAETCAIPPPPPPLSLRASRRLVVVVVVGQKRSRTVL